MSEIRKQMSEKFVYLRKFNINFKKLMQMSEKKIQNMSEVKKNKCLKSYQNVGKFTINVRKTIMNVQKMI